MDALSTESKMLVCVDWQSHRDAKAVQGECGSVIHTLSREFAATDPRQRQITSRFAVGSEWLFSSEAAIGRKSLITSKKV